MNQAGSRCEIGKIDVAKCSTGRLIIIKRSYGPIMSENNFFPISLIPFYEATPWVSGSLIANLLMSTIICSCQKFFFTSVADTNL